MMFVTLKNPLSRSQSPVEPFLEKCPEQEQQQQQQQQQQFQGDIDLQASPQVKMGSMHSSVDSLSRPFSFSVRQQLGIPVD